MNKLSEMTNNELVDYAINKHISLDSPDLIKELVFRLPPDPILTKRKNSFPIFTTDSICKKCKEQNNCPMNQALDAWYEIEYIDKGKNNIDEHTFKEHYIDEPEVEDNIVEWCPMYEEQ